MDYYKKIFKESILIVIFSSIMGLFSGSLLLANEEILYAIPIILLILPSLNSLIGDMATISISRLTTHLYIGTIPPKIQKSDRLKEDLIALLITISLSLVFLIILGFAIGISTGITITNPFLIILIVCVTIFLIFIIMFVALFISSIIIFRRGKDPNNFLIPFVTSGSDFLTPLFLVMFLQIFI